MVNGGEAGAESYDIATAALVLLTATTDFVPNCADSVLLGGTSEADDNKETSPELRWRRDLNPRSVLADSRFQGECIRPLCHATAGKRSARRNRPSRQA